VDERGEIACVLEWGAWGHAEAAAGSRTTTPLRFPGQYEEQDVGLSYNRARYYSPDLARFISSDPIGLRGGTNEFRYPINPLRYRDPFGLDPFSEGRIGPPAQAYLWQGPDPNAQCGPNGLGFYQGHDSFKDHWLPAGSVVAMGERGVSGFATTKEAVHGCNDSRSAVFQGLQVNKGRDRKTRLPNPDYRPTMGLYKTTQGMWVASGVAKANTGNGPGGLPQYFIPGVKNDPAGTGMVDPSDPRFTRVGEIPLGP
jgi:RHS repeat-associated protein